MTRHLFLAALLLLAGCSAMTRSDYQRPMLSLPTGWPTMTEKETENGWRFNDARLSRVIEQVLESNNDLAAAAITLLIE